MLSYEGRYQPQILTLNMLFNFMIGPRIPFSQYRSEKCYLFWSRYINLIKSILKAAKNVCNSITKFVIALFAWLRLGWNFLWASLKPCLTSTPESLVCRRLPKHSVLWNGFLLVSRLWSKILWSKSSHKFSQIFRKHCFVHWQLATKSILESVHLNT